MARAYIALARGDIDDNMLQILDLQPNSSLRNPIYEGAGQTGYMAWTAQNETIAHTNAGGVLQATATYVGLATYIGARVDDITGGGNNCVVALEANRAAQAILARVRQGQALTLAGINAAIQSVPGLATSGIVGTGTSTATVAEILRIVGGEVFQIAAAIPFSGAAGIFLGTAGAFIVPVVVNGITTYPAAWRHVRPFIDTGSLHQSRFTGALSQLAAATYVWNNPALTYAPANTATGTALVIAGLVAGDTFTLKDIPFTCVNGVPNPAVQEYQDIAGSTSDVNSATTLVTAINDPATQALIAAVALAGTTCTASNVGGTSATVTITASVMGAQGQFTMLQTGAHLTLSGAALVAAADASDQGYWVDATPLTSTTSLALTVYDATGAVILN